MKSDPYNDLQTEDWKRICFPLLKRAVSDIRQLHMNMCLPNDDCDCEATATEIEEFIGRE